MREALQHQGFTVVTPQQARDEPRRRRWPACSRGTALAVTAADLAEAAYAVAAGAVWVATNTDATLPTHRGTAPGNGTLVAAVQRGHRTRPARGRQAARPAVPLCAPSGSGASPPQVLAVGDRLDTDIAGAVAAGMDSVLVLTGVDSVTSLAVAPPARASHLPARGPAVAVARPYVAGRDRLRAGGCAVPTVVGSSTARGTWRPRGAPSRLPAPGSRACTRPWTSASSIDDAVRRLVPEIDAWQ